VVFRTPVFSDIHSRYNVLDAYSAKGIELITITKNAYINSDTLVELLTAINRLHPATDITLVMGQRTLSALR
jgi:hypothetical protein